MSGPESTPSVVTTLSEARCPHCGNEDGIKRVDENNDSRIPYDSRGHCSECGHRATPLAFHDTWVWERLTDSERKEAREAAVGAKHNA